MERAEWALTLRQVFADVQLQALESSSYLQDPEVSRPRSSVSALRRLGVLYDDEVRDGRGVAEEAFLLFLDEMWLALARVLTATKLSDTVLTAVGAFVGDFLHRKGPKSKEELRGELLGRLLGACGAEDRSVRLRATHVLQIVVNRLDTVGEALEKQLVEGLLPRLKDKLAAVRIQAVYALKRLQKAGEDDPVATELQKLLVEDPSKDVRRAALLNLEVTKDVYEDLVVRIRDVSEDVRYAAFRTLGNAVPMTDVPINDRAHLLDQGLQDRSPRVRRACEQMVLRKWFPDCDASPVLLLKALDIELYPEIGSKVARLLLKHFSEQPRALLEKEGVVEFNMLEMLSEDSEALNAETIFFWREQCNYYQKVDNDPEKAAALVPNVTDFSKLLVTTCKAGSAVLFIAQQLLELGHLLDFQDEFGRRNLLDALQKLLRELETDSQLIKGIMELMAFVYTGSSEQEFIQVVAEIISDVYDPVEQDTAEISSSQPKESQNDAEEEAQAISFGPQLNKLSEEEREEAEDKFEELEKRLESLELDSEEYVKVQAEMLELEKILQDPRVLSWLRCLEIVAQLLKLTSHNLSNPIVGGMGRYILPAIDSDIPALREAGLENLGLFCLLDKRLAERYLVVFWRALNNPEEEGEVKHTCVQAILDMAFSFSNLQPHIIGVKQPDEPAQDAEGESNARETPVDPDQDKDGDEPMEQALESEAVTTAEKLDLDTIFIGLGQLIAAEDLDLQSTIVEGFCRLFMMNRIDNTTVLAILLETYFNPKLQKVQQLSEHGFHSRTLQLLSIFFPAFVMATASNCMLLEEAAMHLIQQSMEKLGVESDSVLDYAALAKYVMHLLGHSEQNDEAAIKPSRGSKAKQLKQRRCAHHNRIGINICLEILALEKVRAMPSIHQDVVAVRHKVLLKMITWTEITIDELRSAALFKFLLEEIVSTCFKAQRGLLRSAEAFLKRTSSSFNDQIAKSTTEQESSALEQDETWAHDLIKEREGVLSKVLLQASVDHEKSLKRQKAQRRKRYVSSSESSSEESDSEADEEETAVPARRELSSRRSKTAAVDRMHQREGEFDAKMKRALDADKDSEEEEESEEESESEEEEESSADEDE